MLTTELLKKRVSDIQSGAVRRFCLRRLNGSVMAKLWCAIICICMISAISSHAATHGLFTYYINSDDTVRISGYPRDATGAVVIPATIDGRAVTEIRYDAFRFCGEITSVSIPDSVTIIGENPFYQCSSLTEIIVASGNTQFTSVDGVLFNSSQTTLIQYPGGKTGAYVIPNAVTAISPYGFSGCLGLTNVTIPDSVVSIGDRAFYRSLSLTQINVAQGNAQFASVDGVLFDSAQTTLIQYPGGKTGAYTIPNTVTTIGSYGFSGCPGLTSVSIPVGVITIGSGTFSYCTSLISMTIPDGVTSIGGGAFAGCASLETVSIPQSVTSMYGSAFEETPNLRSINVHASNSNYSSLGGVLLNHYQSRILHYPAARPGAFTIPQWVREIDDDTFLNRNGLTSITIHEDVEMEMWRTGLLACKNITEYIVEPGHFRYSSAHGMLLSRDKTILIRCPAGIQGTGIIPSTVTSFIREDWEGEEEPFEDCTGLTDFSVEAGNTTFASLDGVLYNTDFTILFVYPTGKAGAYTVPEGVSTISNGAFYQCTNLTDVKLPASLTKINRGAFYGCTSLTSIIIPPGVNEIDEYAFKGCSNMAAAYFSGPAPRLEPDGNHYTNVFEDTHDSFIAYHLEFYPRYYTPEHGFGWNGLTTHPISISTYPAAQWLLEANLLYDNNLNQDLNGDGVSLLMAYALNLNPNQQLNQSLPKTELNADSVSMKYYSGSAGVTYRVETSKDLKTWVTTNITISDPDSDGIRTASIPRDDICGFLRLVVVEE